MRKKDPFEESYGRHSNFRAERDGGSSGIPLGKWLFAVFLVAAVVLGVDRVRGRNRLPPTPPSAEQLPAAAQPSPGEPLVEVSATPPPMPAEPVAGNAPPSHYPAADTTALDAEHAKPETEVRYEMRMNGSNSFTGQGEINGREVVLLADTGASMVVVPERLAQELGLKKGQVLPFKTGGGNVDHYATTLNSLTLGRIEIRNVEAAINPAMKENFVLLGMSALKLMEMEYGDGKLVLKHRQRYSPREMRSVDEEDFKRSVSDCKGRGNKFDQQTLDCLRGR